MRMQKADDPGKFRQLDEILFINDYPGYQHLFSIAENCMQVVCEIKGSNYLYVLVNIFLSKRLKCYPLSHFLHFSLNVVIW